MKINNRIIVAISFVLVALGFLFSFWPLSVGGIILAVYFERWVAAILLGLLLDLAFGTPLGRFHFLYFPFTLLAVVLVIVRYVIGRYLRKGPVERI